MGEVSHFNWKILLWMTNSILVRDFSGIRLAELREEIQRVREYGNKNQTVIYLYEYHDDSPCLCRMVLISKKCLWIGKNLEHFLISLMKQRITSAFFL